MNRLAALVYSTSAAVFLLACSDNDSAPDRVDVHFDEHEIHAEVARTAEERAHGLGGRHSMTEDAGMLFTTGEERVPAPWMKGMLFSLDFVFISKDNRVVQVISDVPPSPPGTPDSDLPQYSPREPVLYFLEVNAGVARAYGIQEGDPVEFEPEP